MGLLFSRGRQGDVCAKRVEELEAFMGALAERLEAIASGDVCKNAGQSLPEIESSQSAKRLSGAVATLQTLLPSRLKLASMAGRELSLFVPELDSMAESLRSLSSSISGNADSVDLAVASLNEQFESAAASISSLNGQMHTVSEHAEDSSSSVAAIAAATEEMTSTIAEIAKGAEGARAIANNASASVEVASERVSKLGSAAAGIEEVVKVINEISDQTKLLALNATIEAARAGEAGKGFAVVANEVKELAKQTGSSTDDIRTKVEAINAAVKETVDEMMNIRKVIEDVSNAVSSIATAVEEQSSATKDMARNLASVAGGVSGVTGSIGSAAEAVGGISKSLESAAASSSQVATSVSGMAADNRKMMSGSSSLYASIMELSSGSEELADSLSAFKLPKLQDRRREFVRFTPAYDVCVESLNKQHRKIMDYINSVHSSVKSGGDLASIRKTLNEMAAFVVDHFACEERHFAAHSYPHAEAHKRIHTELLDTVKGLLGRIDRGEDVNLIETLKFLKSWLQDHIKGTDKKYGPFLKDRGVS